LRTKTYPRGSRLGIAAAPDESIILRFRHLRELYDLHGDMLVTVNLYLDSKASASRREPSWMQRRSTRPVRGRTPARSAILRCIRQKKGDQYYFGAKTHIGVDSKETIVHFVIATAASLANAHMLPELLHGEENKVCHPTDEDLPVGTPARSDASYQGQTEAIHETAPQAQNMTNYLTKFKNYVDEEGKRKNRTKSSVRAKVEHPFRILKRVFGFIKVRYRRLKKNYEWLCAAFAQVNLYQHNTAAGWPLKRRSVSGGRETASRD
jgi:IS5 family transposase